MDSLIKGEIPFTQDVSGKQIKEYNFRQPDRYSLEQQKDIWMLGEDIFQKMNTEFTDLLNDRCEFNVNTVDQMTNIEFLRSIPQKCFFYDFDYINNGITVEFDPEIGKALLKQDYKKYEAFTQFDMEVLRDFYINKLIKYFAGKIVARVGDRIDRNRFDLSKSSASGNSNNTKQDENMMMLLLGLKCKIGSTTGYINIQISAGLIEDLLLAGFFSPTASDKIKFQILSNIKEKQIPDNIFIKFVRFNPEKVFLEFGKILVLDKKETEPLNVVYKNRVIHTGQVMAIDENFGIKIAESVELNEITYDEEDYISIQLGTSALTEQEISNLHKDSYIVLKQRAGEVSNVIRTGKIIGTGEICIADDTFSIKIFNVK